jgi:hypothetical protein
MKLVRGKIDIEAVDFTIAELIIGFVTAQQSDVEVDVKAVDGLITLAHIYGGLVYLSRPVTTLIVVAGRVVIDDYEPATVYQYGGTVEYMTPSAAPGGTITEYNLGGGVLDLTRSYKPKAITTLNLFGSPTGATYMTDRYATIGTINDYRIPG